MICDVDQCSIIFDHIIITLIISDCYALLLSHLYPINPKACMTGRPCNRRKRNTHEKHFHETRLKTTSGAPIIRERTDNYCNIPQYVNTFCEYSQYYHTQTTVNKLIMILRHGILFKSRCIPFDICNFILFFRVLFHEHGIFVIGV